MICREFWPAVQNQTHSPGRQHHLGRLRPGSSAFWLVLFLLPACFCWNRPGFLRCQLHQSVFWGSVWFKHEQDKEQTSGSWTDQPAALLVLRHVLWGSRSCPADLGREPAHGAPWASSTFSCTPSATPHSRGSASPTHGWGRSWGLFPHHGLDRRYGQSGCWELLGGNRTTRRMRRKCLQVRSQVRPVCGGSAHILRRCGAWAPAHLAQEMQPISRFLPLPIPGHFPLFIEDRLFSLVSNLFLYDLLKLFMPSTIKPLKRSKTNKNRYHCWFMKGIAKRVYKCIGTWRWQDGREAYCGNVIYNHLNVYLIHVLKRYLTCSVWFHKWFKKIFKYVWHLFWLFKLKRFWSL